MDENTYEIEWNCFGRELAGILILMEHDKSVS